MRAAVFARIVLINVIIRNHFVGIMRQDIRYRKSVEKSIAKSIENL